MPKKIILMPLYFCVDFSGWTFDAKRHMRYSFVILMV